MTDFELKAGSGMNHGINTSAGMIQKCPTCGAGPEDWEVENYSMMWHDGDIICQKCGTRVRGYDAG